MNEDIKEEETVVEETVEEENTKTVEETVEEKEVDPAEKVEEEDDKIDPNKTSTDIVFPENFSEDAQSKLEGVFKDQESLDKTVAFLTDISSQETEKQDNAMKAKLAEWDNTLRKDDKFGLDYDSNMEDVNKFVSEQSEGFQKFIKDSGVDKNPEFVKTLHSIVKERADADIHINNSKEKAPVKSGFDFSKTLNEINKK